MAIESYVKFLRGTPTAFDLLTEKNKDTLYFISEKDSDFGTLYLGDKIVARGEEPEKTTLDSLKDVVINEGLEDGSLLVYDANFDSWINLPIAEVIKQAEEQDFGWIKEIADAALEEAHAAKQEVDALKNYVIFEADELIIDCGTSVL